MKKNSYDDIKSGFEQKGCKILTTEDEFIINKMNGQSKYNIIASCGHQVDNCRYNMFKCRNTGLICKSCTDQHRSKQNTELNKNINGNSYALNIEFQSVKLLKKYIETSVLEIKISPECCLADLCIKDVNCVNNKWLPIQLKSTTKAHDNIYIHLVWLKIILIWL